jgi:hypothetical protein
VSFLRKCFKRTTEAQRTRRNERKEKFFALGG